MGVRGLTTYIERNEDKYLKRYKLRDTHLVIDGNSLCAQLYKYYAKCNDIFGGDYDKYAKCITTFFSLLSQCNVTPIVIFDGGYEAKKLTTVYSRLQNKLKIIYTLNPVCAGSVTLFPLFHRECFKDTLLKLKIPIVRCDFEADFDIACVARKLGCPVLSYDSDFYIFDVLYIPFRTLDLHLTKINDDQGSKCCIQCKIYDIDNFLKQLGGLDKSQLPLMATLLGNDYIKKSVFNKFYNHIKLPKKGGFRSDQHRTIMALIKWLRTETFDSAVKKILGRLKTYHRSRVAKQIKEVTKGYVGTHTKLFEYLNLTDISEDTTAENPIQIDIEDIQSEPESEAEDQAGSSDSDCDDSDKTNDSEEEVDLTTVSEEKHIEIIQSDWFRNNFRKCNFPTLFIDILSLRLAIYQSQIEDISNIHTVNIVIPLLQAIGKILLQDIGDEFEYLTRNENGSVRKVKLELSQLNLPKLSDIEGLSKEQCTKVLLQILELTQTDWEQVCQLPEKWKLYFLSLVYWSRKSSIPKINKCHVYSIILCLFYLNIVDSKAPGFRLKSVFLKKYENKLKQMVDTRNSEINSVSTETINNILKNISIDDCLFFIDSFVSHFVIDDKTKSNKNLFSIHVVDAFAQFQSCLLYIHYLNSLLQFPLPSFDISLFYNGTFIYNLYANLSKRTDVDSYIELLLKNSVAFSNLFKRVFEVFNSLTNVSSVVTSSKKRRKRKKQEKQVVDDNKSEISENNDDGDDALYDANNKFSILAMTD